VKNSMRAAVITKAGGPDVLEVREVPRPVPGDAEVLVRVRASALNRADMLQRRGNYPAPPDAPQDIPGLEIAGEVAARGPGSGRWSVGDRVFGIVGGGGNAEYATTKEDELAAIPQSLSWEEAAAIPEAFITAHDALITQAAMRPGESVLIHAVGSGVGIAAVQLVRALGGRAFGTARTKDKIDRARALGLENGVVVGKEPGSFVEPVKRWTDNRGVDVVIDLVGGDYIAADISAAAMKGRIMLVGLLAGRSTNVDLGGILRSRLTIRGTVLRSRPAQEKVDATRAFARDVLPLLAGGKVKPLIERVFPLEHIRFAHELMESNETFGKIVISHDRAGT
jgi:NADPH2:quinone reductase